MNECCANCKEFDEEYLYCWRYGNHAPLNGKCCEYKRKARQENDSECCATCRLAYRIQKLDYSKVGCEHTDMDGYICMAFADEGLACYMVGQNPDTGMCECYTPKEDT